MRDVFFHILVLSHLLVKFDNQCSNEEIPYKWSHHIYEANQIMTLQAVCRLQVCIAVYQLNGTDDSPQVADEVEWYNTVDPEDPGSFEFRQVSIGLVGSRNPPTDIEMIMLELMTSQKWKQGYQKQWRRKSKREIQYLIILLVKRIGEAR